MYRADVLILTVALMIIAAVSVLRVEHLIASDVWICLRGRRWRDLVILLNPEDWEDKELIWRFYKVADGGALPWLFFGIRSYRLAAWAQACRSRRWSSLAIKGVRLLWRYYVFAPLTALMVAVLAVVPTHLSQASRIALLVVAGSTVLGMIAMAAEGTVAAFTLKSWAVDYHRRMARETPAGLRELAVILFCLVLALGACYSWLLVIATRFGGFNGFPMHSSVADKLQAGVQLAIPAFISNDWSGLDGAAGSLGAVLVAMLYFSYFFVLLFIAGQKLWD